VRRVGLLAAAAVLLGSCSPAFGPGDPTHPPGATTVPRTGTTISGDAPTTFGPIEANVVVPMRPFVNEMGAGWTTIDFPRGSEEGQLGPTTGAEHGTQTTDGTWWFVDNANRRFLRFDSSGRYVDDIPIPANTIEGEIPNYRAPRGLEDGTLAAYAVRLDETKIVRAFGDTITSITLIGQVPWDYTDGSFLYGPIRDGTPAYRVEPWAGVVTGADWYVARNQARFMVTVEGSDTIVDLIDYSTTVTLQMRLSEQPEIETNFEVQFVTATDGTLYILAYGNPLTDTTQQVGALVTMDKEGRVLRTQQIVDPRQGGAQARIQFGLLPGTASPWILVGRDDGVRAFVRVN
jgi:hypothetical protein